LHLLVLLVLQVGDLLSKIFVCIMQWLCQELMQGDTAPLTSSSFAIPCPSLLAFSLTPKQPKNPVKGVNKQQPAKL